MRIWCIALSTALLLPSAFAAKRRAVRITTPTPSIESITPAEGPITGETEVVIRGIGFTADSRVTVAKVAMTAARVVSFSEIRLATPAAANGFAAVSVENANGRASGEFLFVPPSPASIGRGFITTVAGIGTFLAEGRPARESPLNEPTDVSIDAAGNVYVAEVNDSIVRRISPRGEMEIIAGTGATAPPGFEDLNEGGLARETHLSPRGMTVGPDQNLYITDVQRIRRIDLRTNRITTVAGSGPNTFTGGGFAGDGGQATEARLNLPNRIDFDAAGNMFILDTANFRIRKVAADGIITTVAGNGTRGFSGDDGPALNASFDPGPPPDRGTLEVAPDGTLYLCDSYNFRLRKIDAVTGIITTIAGGGTRTDDGIPGTTAQIQCNGVVLAPDGSLYFSELPRIRKLDPNGIVTTVHGSQTRGVSPDGTAGGLLTTVERMALADPQTLLFIEGVGISRVRKLDLTRGVVTTLAGIGPAVLGENGPATRALLSGFRPQLGLDSHDRPVFGSQARLVRLELDGTLRTLAGGGIPGSGPPPPVRPALGTPANATAIGVDGADNIYAGGEFEVGRVSPDGIYRKLAGAGYGYAGDGGPATSALFDLISGLAVDGDGNVFVADTWNCTIRRIGPNGIVTTFAGKYVPHPPGTPPTCGSSGDGGLATNAELGDPTFIAVDGAGNVYFNDRFSTRRIDRDGIITTVLPGCKGPLATDRRGRVHVYCFNAEIRRIDGPNQSTLVGKLRSEHGFSGDGGPSDQAQARDVSGMAIDAAGNVYLYDSQNLRVRVIKGIAD